MEVLSIVSDLTSFGAAGLMGAMWLCERKLNRDREQQLTDAHHRIGRDEERLAKLTEVIDRNTSAITSFVETQRDMAESIRNLIREIHHDFTS